MNDLLAALAPHLVELASGVVATLLSIAAAKIYAATGVYIEAKHRDALKEAMISGATAALRLGPDAGLQALKAHAIAYVQESAPDAIRKLIKGRDGVLDKMAERYVREALGGGAAAPIELKFPEPSEADAGKIAASVDKIARERGWR